MQRLTLNELTVPDAANLSSQIDIDRLTGTQRETLSLFSELYSCVDRDVAGELAYYQHLAGQIDQDTSMAVAIHNTGLAIIVAGAATYHLSSEMLEIRNLIVGEQFRRSPILHVGTFIVHGLIDTAIANDLPKIELDSNLTDVADNFYANLGFVATGFSRRQLVIE